MQDSQVREFDCVAVNNALHGRADDLRAPHQGLRAGTRARGVH